MLFTAKITAPAGTPEALPAKVTVELAAGVLNLLRVHIPEGHAYKAHLAIRHGETAIIPWGDGQYLEGDGETLEWNPDFQLPSKPARLTLAAWNEGIYDHSFYLKFWVETQPSKILDLRLLTEVLTRLEKFLKRIQGAA